MAARLRKQQACGLGNAKDPFGYLGRNGVPTTPEVNGTAPQLQPLGEACISWLPERVHNR